MDKPSPFLRSTKIALWLYFWLLLFEGILRKWIIPQWSDYVFIARDPLVLLTYVLAWRAGVFPRRPAMAAVWLLAVVSLAFSLASDAPFVVTLFGLRTDFLHLPLIFVMEAAMTRDDVLRFGRWFMLTSIPIVLLMVIQFNAKPDSIWNVGAGAVETGQIWGAMDKIRPPGPFSFIAGAVCYFSLLAAFVCHGWLSPRQVSLPLLILASLALVVAAPISISRSLSIALAIVVLFALASVARDFRRIPRLLGPLMAGFACLVSAGDTVYVRAFFTRWDDALGGDNAGFYGSVVTRIGDLFRQPFELAANAPWFGHGIGLGTIGGAKLVTGKHVFLLSESELARIVLELGPLLGFAFILWRGWLAARMIRQSWGAVTVKADSLPWLIGSASFYNVFCGQWGPATQLGFAVLGAGLTLAALREPVDLDAEDVLEGEAVG